METGGHSFTEGMEFTTPNSQQPAASSQQLAPTIKFSHCYLKLTDAKGNAITEARLLQVQPVDISTLSKEFFDYDTDNGKYKLPFKGMYLMLIFQKPNLDLFTTLRSMHSYDKWNRREINKLPYYQNLVGKTFNIAITTEKEVCHG